MQAYVVSIGLVALGLAGGCQKAESPTPQESPAAPGAQADASMQSRAASSLSISLSGAQEVPAPGDPDGTGTAKLTLDESKGEVCYELVVENIQSANAAHVHQGSAGSAGGVVVPLEPPAQGSSQGCAPANPEVVRDIAQNPANYYVNVHNEEFPQGAVRGQLQ